MRGVQHTVPALSLVRTLHTHPAAAVLLSQAGGEGEGGVGGAGTGCVLPWRGRAGLKENDMSEAVHDEARPLTALLRPTPRQLHCCTQVGYTPLRGIATVNSPQTTLTGQ